MLGFASKKNVGGATGSKCFPIDVRQEFSTATDVEMTFVIASSV